MLNGQYLDENSDLSEDLETSSVRTVDTHVKSWAWDQLPSAEKVDLLNRTFVFLKTRYPDITKFVNLKFNDGRQDLDLKFTEDL